MRKRQKNIPNFLKILVFFKMGELFAYFDKNILILRKKICLFLQIFLWYLSATPIKFATILKMWEIYWEWKFPNQYMIKFKKNWPVYSKPFFYIITLRCRKKGEDGGRCLSKFTQLCTPHVFYPLFITNKRDFPKTSIAIFLNHVYIRKLFTSAV